MSLSPAQCRAARALIEMTQGNLAEAANVGISTIRSFEAGARSPHTNNLLAIQRAIEEAGVVFLLASAECGAGVRLKTPETAADLTHKIDTIEADIQKTKGPSAQTPAGGMRTLERAHKRNVVTKLKNRRTKLGKT